MKVAFLLWPIAEEGGLSTRARALVALHRRNGIRANFYRLHYNDRLHGHGSSELETEINANGGLRLQGRHLSVTTEKLAETVAHLDSYDELVFVHPCPHVTDKGPGVKNWRYLYQLPRAPKSTYFTDVYAEQFYPWIADVIGLFRPLAVNDAVARHVRATMDIEPTVVPHPWEAIPRSYSPWRERRVLWTSAWRGWKGIKRFCDAVPAIDAPVRLYGTGRELRQWRKVQPADWPGEIAGVQPPERVLDDYQSAYCAVDLTGQSVKYHGHYNRTTLEPMLHGCVSVTLPTLIEPHSRIPGETVWTVDKDNVAGDINELLAKPEMADQIRRDAHDWIKATCSDEQVLDHLWASRSTGAPVT